MRECECCGRSYGLDILIPDELWQQIQVEGQIENKSLCATCIMSRIEELASYDAYRLLPMNVVRLSFKQNEREK